MTRAALRTLKGTSAWRSFGFLLGQETKAVIQTPGEVVVDLLLTPLGYLFLLGAGISGLAAGGVGDRAAFLENLWFMVPGIVAILAYFTTSASMYRLQADRQWGLMAFKLVQGVRPVTYLTSVVTVPLVRFFCQVGVLFAAAFALGLRPGFGQSTAVLLGGAASALTWLAVGGVLVFLVKRQANRAVVLRVLTLPMMFSAPTFYPLASMPPYLRAIATFNPLTYQLGVIRGEVVGVPIEMSWVIVASLMVVTVLTLILCVSFAEPVPSQGQE